MVYNNVGIVLKYSEAAGEFVQDNSAKQIHLPVRNLWQRDTYLRRLRL